MTVPVPVSKSDAVHRTMVSNRRRDTKPELAIRRLLHAAGLRYRVDYAPDRTRLRRRADIVFTRARVAVFVDGCFWHGCPAHYVQPKSNLDYWTDKIERNRTRDRDTDLKLREEGWTVLRYWEHEEPAEVAYRIASVVSERGSAPRRRLQALPDAGTAGPTK